MIIIIMFMKRKNGYYKYYTLANGDLDACLKDEMKHNDITKVIRRGLNKSKQNKKISLILFYFYDKNVIICKRRFNHNRNR